MKNLRLFSLFIAICVFGLYSCNKDNPVTIDTTLAETEGDVDDALAEIDGVTETAMSSYGVSQRIAENNDTVMISCADKSINRDLRIITIDFGDGCQGYGGRVRKGKIIITYSEKFFLPGAVITITLENFYINGKKVEGIRTLTNTSESLLSSPRFNVTLQGGKVIWPDSTFATRESNFTNTWTRADNPLNDELSVEGSANGTTRKGKQYTMDITSPLDYKNICRLDRVFIAVSGKKEFQADGQTMIFDYGEGTCDRLVTISVNGVSREIEVTKGQ